MSSTTISAFAAQGSASKPRASRLRITARGRAVVAALALAPVVIVAIALSSVPASASDAPADAQVSFGFVTVEAGESLWSIAERIAPEADPREVITEIATLNGLDGASVAAGQSLAVPLRYAD